MSENILTSKIIILDNKKAQIISEDPSLLRRLRVFLSFKMSGVEYTPAFKNGWSGITYLLTKNNSFNLGLLEKVKGFLLKNKAEYTIQDKRKNKSLNESIDLSINLNKYNLIPREHQLRICNVVDLHDRGIVRAATGAGKCSDINSLHLTEYGLLNYAEIKEILNEKINPKESCLAEIKLATPLKENNEDVSAELYYDGYGESKKITTNYGFTLTATPNHKIQILDKNGEIVWKEFKDLNEEDNAIISFNNQFFGKKIIPLDEAYWYGLLIGDGSLTSKTQIKLTNKDNHILNFAENFIKKYNIKYAKKVKSKSKAFDIVINNSGYRKQLKNFGLDYEKSIHKTLPLNIRMLSKKPLAMVLRGIYEADGWVEMTKGKPGLCLGLSNKNLIDQIHLILLNFGIVASRRLKKTTHEDSHILIIYKEFIPAFIKEIGLDYKGYKYKRLNWAMKKNSLLKNNSNINLIPNQNLKIKKLINFFTSTLSKKTLLKSPVKFNTLRSWSGSHSWRCPSRENLSIFIKWYESKLKEYSFLTKEIENIINSINYICNNNFYYLSIKKIEDTFSDNYDFYIPKTHSFVSQGFINHNTMCTALITAKKNTPTIIYVIGLDLLDQFHKLFSKLFDEKIGYIGNGVCEPERITIASIWTIGRSLSLDDKSILDDEVSSEKEIDKSSFDKIKECLLKAKLHIFDESHVVTTNTIAEIYKAIDPEYIYGFSGTPFRGDNSDLLINGILGEQIIDVPASELIKKGLLAQPIIKFVAVPKKHLENNSQYQSVYKEYIVENDIRNNLIIKSVQMLLDKKYTPLVLFKQIKHGDILLEKMQNANMKCEMLHGNDSIEQRNKVKEMLVNGEINVILASTIFDIGLDLPELSGLVLCGGGNSNIRALQRIGRILRIIPGKTNAAVIDFFDQAKFLKKHSIARYNIYASESGFKILPCKEMKIE